MPQNYKEFVENNEKYVAAFDKGGRPLPPKRKALIIVCMDARIDPHAALGLDIGDAHVVRNAGGRAADALRSVIISQRLLGTTEVYIIHHTDCGMLLFSNQDLITKVKEDTGADVSGQDFCPFSNIEQSVKVNDIQEAREPFLLHTFLYRAGQDFYPFSNIEQSVKDDIQLVKSHPAVPNDIPVMGFVYDVDTGKLTPVDA